MMMDGFILVGEVDRTNANSSVMVGVPSGVYQLSFTLTLAQTTTSSHHGFIDNVKLTPQHCQDLSKYGSSYSISNYAKFQLQNQVRSIIPANVWYWPSIEYVQGIYSTDHSCRGVFS